jgi:hypothetical protein
VECEDAGVECGGVQGESQVMKVRGWCGWWVLWMEMVRGVCWSSAWERRMWRSGGDVALVFVLSLMSLGI